jgi:hypothetical protein
MNQARMHADVVHSDMRSRSTPYLIPYGLIECSELAFLVLVSKLQPRMEGVDLRQTGVNAGA